MGLRFVTINNGRLNFAIYLQSRKNAPIYSMQCQSRRVFAHAAHGAGTFIGQDFGKGTVEVKPHTVCFYPRALDLAGEHPASYIKLHVFYFLLPLISFTSDGISFTKSVVHVIFSQACNYFQTSAYLGELAPNFSCVFCRCLQLLDLSIFPIAHTGCAHLNQADIGIV